MVVLLTGASGFIGEALLAGLLAAGHAVIAIGRRPPAGIVNGQYQGAALRFMRADLMRDLEPAVWRPRLAGVDAVINAAGIFTETSHSTFDAIHTRAPQALFTAAAECGVRRIIQISALGVTGDLAPPFLRSKYCADDFLLALRPNALVLRPSLVFDREGPSARLFMQLAAMPLIMVPGEGRQQVQPVHRGDLCCAVVNALVSDDRGIIAAVGPEALQLRGYLSALRSLLGLQPAPVIPLPLALVRLGSRLPGIREFVSSDSLSMLAEGSYADPAAFSRLLGAAPRPVSHFLEPTERRLASLEARLCWLLPLLRYAIALVWFTAGIVSLGIYPVEQSLRLLAATGATGALAWLLLYGAAAFDLALGVATLTLWRRRWLWQLQIALIVFYTLVISIALPEFWAHPYGPIVKNLPMLAGILLLMELEGRRWNT